MANFYNENRKFYFQALNLEEVVRDLEDDFSNDGPSGLGSYEEAQRWYDMLLHNAGDIAANFVWPRAKAVDEHGPSFHDGHVEWAEETKENMAVLAKTGLAGGALERKYGGLNLPVSVNNLIIEMISQGDASLMNLFGLQDIGITLQKFGSEDQKERILPRFARGEISGAMALTEPDAGSDLQSVALKAIEKDGKWYLDGVKRFITNGCGDVLLVLARSEEGSKDGRGLSMFLYEKDENMLVRRIEDKLGIHGSPTCELNFHMAEAELVGRRRFGLIRYLMSLMSGARLAVSAQALGIAQAAYEEAVKYANKREQFGKKIVEFPPIFQMLKKIQAEIETSRVLVNNTALEMDRMDMYERKAERGEDVGSELKVATALANFLTALSKFTSTEMANKVAYDALQIHGGVGYMKDFHIERLYRDARITNIYEGTTQLQVVAAIGAIVSGLFQEQAEKVREMDVPTLTGAKGQIAEHLERMNALVDRVKEREGKDFLDYAANYIVEMASIIYRLYLFLPIAERYEEKRELFEFFLMESNTRIGYLVNEVESLMENYGENIAVLKEDFLNKP
ncbi:acyl-CoA dehydrogenase family protein [Nitrospinota bacterium]